MYISLIIEWNGLKAEDLITTVISTILDGRLPWTGSGDPEALSLRLAMFVLILISVFSLPHFVFMCLVVVNDSIF